MKQLLIFCVLLSGCSTLYRPTIVEDNSLATFRDKTFKSMPQRIIIDNNKSLGTWYEQRSVGLSSSQLWQLNQKYQALLEN